MKQLHFNASMLMVAFVILIGIFPMGCGKKKETLAPYGWTATGLHSDSLLIQADRALMSYADSYIIDSLVNEYCIISEKEDPGKVYEHRRLYWKGNARFMHGDYEQGDSLRRLALAACDSSVFPRDYRLYRMVLEQPSDFPDNAYRYRRYRDDLNVFIKSRDFVSGFTRAVQLSGLMTEAGMTKEALEYAILSDSLLANSGLPTLRINNRVNIASALAAVGDTVRAIKELRTVRNSTISYSIPSIAAIVDYNLFQLSGEMNYLHKAWDTVSKFEELEKMRPLVAAAIINSGNIRFADLTELNDALQLSSDYDYSPAELLEISGALLQNANNQSNVEKIKNATAGYRKAVRNYIETQQKGEIIAAQTAEQIREVEDREKSVRETLHTRVLSGIAICTIILAMTGIIVYRYVERKKRVAMLTQLESERLRREIMTKELIVVEKQKLNEKLQRTVDDLVREKKIEKMTAKAISKIIESTSTKSSIEQEDAEFLKAFIEKYPNVSKTGRKIALLIWKGLDTADIAREMNIRKESVLQARWRLRNQMGLSNVSDLDVILRNG